MAAKRKKKTRANLRDLAPRRNNPKGGISAPSVPASLQGFLKRNTVPIARGFSADVESVESGAKR